VLIDLGSHLLDLLFKLFLVLRLHLDGYAILNCGCLCDLGLFLNSYGLLGLLLALLDHFIANAIKF